MVASRTFDGRLRLLEYVPVEEWTSARSLDAGARSPGVRSSLSDAAFAEERR